MPGRAAERGQIRSAVREEAGQGGAQSTQARQRPRHLPQAAARGAAYSRRTRRTAAKDTRALRFLNRGKPSYAHGYTSAHRRGRKQYAIPQNKNAPRSKHESPCAPPKLKECLPPDAGKQCAFPDAEKARLSSTQEECALPEIGKQCIRPKHKNHIPAPKQENMYPSRNKKQHASPEAKRDGALFAAASAAHCIGRLSGNAKRKKPLQIQKI